MSEIEMMYKLAQIANEGYDAWDMKDIYPPFTAEKQLALIKWLGTTEYYTFGIFYRQGLWYIFTETTNRHNETFDECLASLINLIWQDLPEEEQQQIKGILE